MQTLTWDFEPKILRGERIQLEPLTTDDFQAVYECLATDPEGWFPKTFQFNSPERIRGAFERLLKINEERRGRAYLVRDLQTSRIAGFSSFMRAEERNRQVEIGFTQIAKDFRRSHVNTEKKFLMLKTAFEELKAVRVYFKADSENLESQKAIARIGARFEGTHRQDCVLPDGRIRDFRVYSILDSEWPEIRARLAKTLAKSPRPAV